MTRLSTSALCHEIDARFKGRDRAIIGISGPPGSGKTTLAADLASKLGPSTVVLPMDGFHLDNARLNKLGLRHRKGAPETFDAIRFIDLLNKIRGGETVSFPVFNRRADRTVPDGGHIGRYTRIVLVEGNYLLLNTPPWSDLAAVFDLTVGLDVEAEELEARLTRRWTDHGFSATDARARVLGNDMKNVKLVAENSLTPDVILQPDK